MTPQAPILVSSEPISRSEIMRLAEATFGDMVKFVVDLEKGRIALGGDLHADAEALLLGEGSRQQDLWGANFLLGHSPDSAIEFTSLINIRPVHGNRKMEIEDSAVRHRVADLALRLLASAVGSIP